MNHFGRNLATAGLVIAGGNASAATPVRLWQHATHFALECRIAGATTAASRALCARLTPIAARTLRLAQANTDDATGVRLIRDLQSNSGRYHGTITATRPAFEGETDARSPPIALSFDGRSPEAGLAPALHQLRGVPMRGPAIRSMHTIGRQ